MNRKILVILLINTNNSAQCLINEYTHVTGYREGKGVAIKKSDGG